MKNPKNPFQRNLFEDFDIDIDETTQEETTHANTTVPKTVSGRFTEETQIIVSELKSALASLTKIVRGF